ncbi:MAG: glycoside hydrolase family 16 protein [Ginsengibacter sp.]
MSKISNTFLLFMAVWIVSCSKKAMAQNTAGDGADTTVYHLVWSDEFNGNAIDSTIWNFETGGNGWGNHEQEFYQPSNASIDNGNLVIIAKKETAGGKNYTSARMTTLGKKAFKYGKIEARIKMPVGQGLWPAFWMLGANITTVNWPACGETDIMEHINTGDTIYGTIHWDNNGHVQNGGTTISTPADYHVYGVKWDADSIRWYVDNIEYHASNITNNSTEEFHQPFFILVNLAVGGDWPGQTINDSLLPAKMYVDYVRVYQK